MNIEVTKINDKLYEFTEYADHLNSGKPTPYVDAYLYIGDEKAFVIDTLQTLKGLYGAVREITDLPLDVLITHGHGDHVGVSAYEFVEAGCKLYMNLLDYEILTMMNKDMKKDWITDIRGGEIFDYGSGQLEAIGCGGHSPGCMVFIDKKNKIMFSGDSLGSGSIWMQLPSCLPLIMYKRNLEKLIEATSDVDVFNIYPGHRNQSPVQLTQEYIKDNYRIVRDIFNGVLEGEDGIIDIFDRHMEFKRTAKGQMLDFCYDSNNLYYRKKTDVESVKKQFQKKEVQDGSNTMNYLLYSPLLEDGKTYPLVLYLHGAGERGRDLDLVLANEASCTFAKEQWQKNHPSYVLAPQVVDDENWNQSKYLKLIMTLLSSLMMNQENQIDVTRIYVTGLSMGGAGTWKLISAYPNVFAGGMPICGAADPFEVRLAKDVPVWAFHAEDDPVVSANDYGKGNFSEYVGSQRLVQSLRGAGNKNVYYTEYPSGWMEEQGLDPHWSWAPAYENQEAKEWLFSQCKNERYQIHFVEPGFYWIDDPFDSSFYIIEGGERSLVIDTGMADNDFIGLVESLTKLPYELAVTHNHGDHMYHLDKFDSYYMSIKDLAMFEEPFMKQMLGKKDYGQCQLKEVADGDIINLGGGYEVEVFELGGHTPGSVVYYDKKRKIALTGDALGVWMQVPGATDISYYKNQLEHFYKRLSEDAYDGLCMMNGHRKQEGGYHPYGDKYVPNDLLKVKDMISLCNKLLADDLDYHPFTLRSFGKPAYSATYGRANMIFTKEQLR